MTRASNTEDAVRSASEAVDQVRVTLDRLKGRLASKVEDGTSTYRDALEKAGALTDELLDLLASS